LIRFLRAWAQVTKKIKRHDEAEAESLIRMGMECLGLDDLGGHGKGSSEKIGLATFVKSRTIITDFWIARRLQMGDPSMVSRYCAEAGSREHVRKISRGLEKAGSKNCPFARRADAPEKHPDDFTGIAKTHPSTLSIK
jgi:hypothetical protein